MRFVARLAPWIAAVAIWRFGLAVVAARTSELRSADEVICAAVLERVGPNAAVSVSGLDVPGPNTTFQTARPDPEGRLGKPMRFTLITGAGTPVIAVATVHVVTDYAVTKRALARNETITQVDIAAARDELVGAPLRRPPTAAELVGARVLRPLPAGITVLQGAVVSRRSIEPGDHVVVVALSGPVQVEAEMVAADGGRIGDIVRTINPATHQYVRGRVIEAGRVEVIHAQ
jgi:flagella basal body P-ring formation protein FlgA